MITEDAKAAITNATLRLEMAMRGMESARVVAVRVLERQQATINAAAVEIANHVHRLRQKGDDALAGDLQKIAEGLSCNVYHQALQRATEARRAIDIGERR